ncbi:hypothetical protein I548_4233 [Mycobacterium intracellulare]|nr:hypothetical protein I548_4233 [Mycobacterium intracellulare]
MVRQDFLDLRPERQRRSGDRVAGVRSAAAAASSGSRRARGTSLAARSNNPAPTRRSLDSSFSP